MTLHVVAQDRPTRLHLTAKPRNEGARRLAWWLGTRGHPPRVALEALAYALRLDALTIDRWLSGELEPGAEISHLVSGATGHAVVTSDWRAPAAGGWFEKPAERQYLVAA